MGQERLRLALDAVAGALGPEAALVDLGCGGGQLCALAARLGYRVTGVDVAPGMIAEAEALRSSLEPEVARRLTLVQASIDDSRLPEGAFDGLTAMGLIEYLPSDSGFFGPARRLLRPGGRLAVSCRNRLYSLYSANEYTARELEGGEAGALLEELSSRLRATSAHGLLALARELAARAGRLAEAANLDALEQAPELLDHPRSFRADRRQHTPAELSRAARAAGFEEVAMLALHPHPLPPALERLAPRVYNQLALAWQRSLAESPAGLALSSAFVAVFELSQP